MDERTGATSGVGQLDRLMGGLYIGDNVVWHDDAGSLASLFSLNFMESSRTREKPLVYVTFDRSPKNLMDKLGALAENPMLTILDCFTFGKGEGSAVFLKFYEEMGENFRCRVLKVDQPGDPHEVMDALYGVHATMEGDVRFVFESMTGMQELWGGEEDILNFYSHSCPRLYELSTIAYWIMEKRAHSSRLRARINQIAQVAIDLSIRRGKTYLTIMKAENRDPDTMNKPYLYWSRGMNVTFEWERHSRSRIDLGMRLRDLRMKRGLSQTELAKLVGVTPSTISQVESNLIYPSLPALLKMAEVLFVEVGSFFLSTREGADRMVFPGSGAMESKLVNIPEGEAYARRLTPVDFDAKAEPYIIEIPPGKDLASHFFSHKGEEMGYLLTGSLEFRLGKTVHPLQAGDTVCLTAETPAGWRNPGLEVARILWIKIK